MVSRAFSDQEMGLDRFLEAFLPQWSVYQEWFSEQSVASFFGLEASSRLSRIPAWAHTLPWGERTPREMMKWLPPRIRRNRRTHGNRISRWRTNSQLMLEDSLTSGASHGKQFFELCESISRNGLWNSCNQEDPFRVWLLKDGKDWCWAGYSGNHRTGAIAALGVSEVHAELQGVISKSSIGDWPNVARGWFSLSEAEKVFDDLFHGRTVPATEELLFGLRKF